jgi:hypothetical protein
MQKLSGSCLYEGIDYEISGELGPMTYHSMYDTWPGSHAKVRETNIWKLLYTHIKGGDFS